MKRVLSIQDISCVGKVALGAALPVISAMGVECSVLPTAVMSTHTAFRNVHIHDMTDQISLISDAWQKEGITFDAICVGYLGSAGQIDAVKELIRRFRGPGTLIIIDPVMGDGGKLYRGFNDEFVCRMRELVSCADIILPNATEAALLTGLDYPEETDAVRAETLLNKLIGHGVKHAVLTGVKGEGETLGAAVMSADDRVLKLHTGEKLPGSYFGTGDLFAAVVTGSLAKGSSIGNAMALAVEFVESAIRNTLADPEKRTYSTSFELSLGWLAERAKRI